MASKDWLGSALRVTALGLIALCAIAMVLGWLPGTEVYRDSNDCFGRALGALFSAHGGGAHSSCESQYVLVRVERAGGWALMASLAPVVLGALAVWRWPRPLVAWLLAFGTFAVLAVAIAATFDLDLSLVEHHAALWPSYAVTVIVGVLAVILMVLFVAMPIIGVVRRRARRRAEEERLPVAKVV